MTVISMGRATNRADMTNPVEILADAIEIVQDPEYAGCKVLVMIVRDGHEYRMRELCAGFSNSEILAALEVVRHGTLVAMGFAK